MPRRRGKFRKFQPRQELLRACAGNHRIQAVLLVDRVTGGDAPFPVALFQPVEEPEPGFEIQLVAADLDANIEINVAAAESAHSVHLDPRTANQVLGVAARPAPGR